MSKMKIVGIVIGSIAAVLILTILILSLVMPAGFWMGAKDAEKEYDDWSKTATSGDTIWISGKIAEKESTSIGGVSIYSYKLEGCDNGFLSSSDVGGKGDSITVQIEIRELGPEASANPSKLVTVGPNACCGVLSLLVLVGGLVLVMKGLKKEKTEPITPKETEPALSYREQEMERAKTRQLELNAMMGIPSTPAQQEPFHQETTQPAPPLNQQ